MQALSALKTTLIKKASSSKKSGLLQRAANTVAGVSHQDTLPDISGLAPYSKDEVVAVRDSKPWQWKSSPLGLVNKKSGKYRPLDWDSNGHSKPFDLESVASTGEPGRYLAVEGTRILGRTPKVVFFEIKDETARTTKTLPLPKLDQQVEGVLLQKTDANGYQIVLAGRGGKNIPAKLYWAELDEKGLHFSQKGQEGVEVDQPQLSGDHRGLTELVADEAGTIWASSAVERWSGEHSSTLRSIGKLQAKQEQPFKLEPGPAYLIEGTKVEGLYAEGEEIYLASDNEDLGGRFEKANKPSEVSGPKPERPSRSRNTSIGQ